MCMTIRCYAERSCFGSTIYTIPDGNHLLQCHGTESCSEATIYGNGTTALFGGYLAANNALLIDVTPFDTSQFSYFDFNGVSSGNGATVICGINNKTCFITCHSNACNNMTLLCPSRDVSATTNDYVNYLNDSDCRNIYFDVDCRYAEQSSICPNGISTNKLNSFNFDIVPKLNMTMSDYENSVEACDTTANTGVINCIDRDPNSVTTSSYCQINTTINQLLFGDPLYNNDNKTLNRVCCSALSTCRTNYNYTFSKQEPTDNNNNNNNNINNYNTIALRCDGSHSCDEYSGTNVQNIYASYTGSNLFFTGRSSSPSTLITNSNEFSSNLICSGYWSCNWNNKYKYGKNMYCTAVNSCNYNIIMQAIENIWLYGYNSGSESVFVDILGNIYCATYEACIDSNMTNVYGSVFGSGYHSLKNAMITNVGDYVIGFGYQSLYQANIVNATNVSNSLVILIKYSNQSKKKKKYKNPTKLDSFQFAK